MSTSEEQLNALATFTSNLLAAEEKKRDFTMEEEGQVDGSSANGDTEVQDSKDRKVENFQNGDGDNTNGDSVQVVKVENDIKPDSDRGDKDYESLQAEDGQNLPSDEKNDITTGSKDDMSEVNDDTAVDQGDDLVRDDNTDGASSTGLSSDSEMKAVLQESIDLGEEIIQALPVDTLPRSDENLEFRNDEKMDDEEDEKEVHDRKEPDCSPMEVDKQREVETPEKHPEREGKDPLSPEEIPNDIEMEIKDDKEGKASTDEPSSPRPKKASLKIIGGKVPKLKIKKLHLPTKAMIGKVSVDLKILKQARPSLFRFEKSHRSRPSGSSSGGGKKKDRSTSESGDMKKPGRPRKSSVDKKQDKPKKERKGSTSSRDKPVKKDKPAKLLETIISDSDSDSDADLKELRAKILKSSVAQNPVASNFVSAKLTTEDMKPKPHSSSNHSAPKSEKEKISNEKSSKSHHRHHDEKKSHHGDKKSHHSDKKSLHSDGKSRDHHKSKSSSKPHHDVNKDQMAKKSPAPFPRPLVLKPCSVVVTRLTAEEIDDYENGRIEFKVEEVVEKVAEVVVDERRSRSPAKSSSVRSLSSSASSRKSSKSSISSRSRSSRSKSSRSSSRKSSPASRKSSPASRKSSAPVSRKTSPVSQKSRHSSASSVLSLTTSLFEGSGASSRSSSASPSRSRPGSADSRTKPRKKNTISSDDDDSDDDSPVKKDDAGPKLVMNPLFLLLGNPSAALLNDEDEKAESEDENVENSEKPRKVEDDDDDKKAGDSKKEDQKEYFERGLLEFNNGLRQFCDAVKIEIGCGSLDCLTSISKGVSKSAKVDFVKFEDMIINAVKSIDRNGQPMCGTVAARPSLSRIPSVPDRYKSKLGSKMCVVKLKDVSHSSKHRKTFQRAKDYVIESRKMKNLKRKERLLSGLRLLKQKSKDHLNYRRNAGDDNKKRRDNEDGVLGSFKIPKKGDKPSKEEKPVEDKSKSQLKTDQYNHSYNKRPTQQQRPFSMKRSFEDEMSAKSGGFSVMDLMSGMKKALNKDDRKKDEIGDIRARERLQEQNKAKANQLGSQTQKPDIDDELSRILSMRVRDKKGNVFSVTTTWVEGRFTMFKCWICNLEMDSRESLMSHLGSHRHLGNKRMFTPVFKDNEQQQQQQRTGEPASEWPPTKSRHSRPDEPLPKPFNRIRNDEKLEEPWKFSPSEAEQQQERFDRMPSFDSRTSPTRNDDYDGYNDDVGGGDDYRDDDSPPPPPPTSFPSLPLSFTLPKPVPIILPKPVPTSRPPVETSLPSTLAPQPSNTRSDADVDPSRSRVRFDVSPERSLTPPTPHPSMTSGRTEPTNSFMRPGIVPVSSLLGRPPSPKPSGSDSGSSSPKPAAGPQPVPPPSRVSSKQKLSVSELGKLPPPMSMKDRVHRYRKGPETPPSPSPDDGISGGDSPPTWNEEERRVIFGPEKSKTTVDGDFKIDTTKSFLDSSKPAEAIAAAGSKASRPEKKPEAEDKPAIKLKPISNLVTTSKPPESGAAGLSSFLDKVIASLKKSGDTPKSSSTSTSGLQLPSLNTSEDDTPHINRSDLFRPKPRPQSSHGGGVSPPKLDEGLFNTENLMQDPEVLKILKDAQGFNNDEGMARAEEKLSVVLSRKAHEQLAAKQLQQQQQQKPKVSEYDLSDFMNKYCVEQSYPMAPAKGAPPLPSEPPPPPPAEPTLSSALAKLRAKKAAKHQLPAAVPHQPPLMMALEKLRMIHDPVNPATSQPPIPPYPHPSGVKRPAPFSESEYEGHKRFRPQDEGRFEQGHPPHWQQDLYPGQPPLPPSQNRFDDGAVIERKYVMGMNNQWKRIHDHVSWRRKLDEHELVAETKQQSQSQDLGSQFMDMRLNQRFVKEDDGQVWPLYTSWDERGVLNFKCELCQVTVFGKKNLDSHMDGKKHLAKVDSAKLADPLPATSGGSYVPAEPLIKETLDKFREAPLIGVEYIVEILRPRSEPSYKCMICKNTFDAAGIIADLVSTTHRLKYLEHFFPIAFEKFSKIRNVHEWEAATFDFLESVALRIETKNGRLVPTVVASENDFNRDAEKIVEKIEAGPHFRQCPDQDFASLPDPFPSLRQQQFGY